MLRLGPLILRNVVRNRRRTLLTLASTAVSLALLALLTAIYQGFFYSEPASPSEALRLVCRHRVSLTNPLTLELTCAGIFSHPQNGECLVFHREYLTELLPTSSPSRDSVGTFLILANSPGEVPRIARAIDAMFENSPYPTRTESEREF